jgi:hypothetical protein
MLGGGPGTYIPDCVGGSGAGRAFGGVGGRGKFGGSVGNGIFGGGTGGGRPIAVMARLGVMNFCSAGICVCSCDAPPTSETDGWEISVLDVSAWGLEVRLPGTKDGVDATARTGRDGLRRNGAGEVRACTDIGRRGCVVWAAGCEVGPMLVETGGGLAGAVTDRIPLTLNRIGAGLEVDVNDDRRRGAALACSVCCC